MMIPSSHLQNNVIAKSEIIMINSTARTIEPLVIKFFIFLL